MSFKTFIINLKKRNDRKERIYNLFKKENINNYFFYEAFDGKKLELNLEIKNLFKYNDFNNRKNIIGCALSHYNIWLDLIKDNNSDYYIIFEDDITLCDNFIYYFNEINSIFSSKLDKIDILLLGYHNYKKKEFTKIIDLSDFDKDNFVGGTFGYIVSKDGAKKLIKYIENNGIKHGIDYLFKIIDNLNIFELNPNIVFSNWVKNVTDNIDSDIQKDYDSFNFNDIHEHYNYLFVSNKDQINNDILFKPDATIDDMFKISYRDNNIHAFNTIGFFKNRIENLTVTDFYKSTTDGIYIKLDKIIRVKMMCNWTNSFNLCEEWNYMSKEDFKWNNIKITHEDNNIDYYVIINKPLNDSEVFIPNKTIIFQMEPSCKNNNQNWGTKTWGEWENPDESSFLEVRKHSNFYNNCTWNLKINYNELQNNYIKKSNNYISTICSSKYYDPGHIKRIDFLKYIENKNDPIFKIDIFGNDNKHNFINYKGSLSDESKLIGIIPYKYYFMAENNSEYNYITEKLWEPLISECLCFYWGAPNINDYIHPDAYVQLDLDDFEKSFNIINDAIINNLWAKRINIIRREKYKVLNYYNYFPTIERTITNDLWKDKLDMIKDKFKIYIIQTKENELNQVGEVLIKTLKYFNFKIEVFETYSNNNLLIEDINDNLKRVIYGNNEIKYFKNNGLTIFNQIRLFEKIISDDNENYLILNDNLDLNSSLNNLFNHIFYLPDDFDVCLLNSSNIKIINQINPLYFIIKKYYFTSNIPYFISNKGCLKILKYINNILSFDEKDLMYNCYNEIADFKLFCSK